MSKMTRLMEQMQADLNSSEEAQNQEPETSTATPPEENSKPEENAAPEESASQETPAEPTPPAGQQAPETPPEPPRKPSDYSPQERAEHAFRRQLARQKEKHEAELKARDKENAELKARLAEIEKKLDPNNAPKTRDQFPNDDEFITYLAEQKVNAIMAERDAQSAKAAEEKAAKDKEAAERDEEVKAQQKVWLDNVDAAFGADPARKTSFLKRVSYCTARGLGEVLDQFPVASDYLFNNPRGPFVFDKLLADRAAFERVFNERNTNPMATYYELRRLDDELLAAEKAAQEEKAAQAETQTQEPVVPHLGKPGRQAAGNSAPDIFSDPKAMKAWLRSH